jgi:uridine phosphorylase
MKSRLLKGVSMTMTKSTIGTPKGTNLIMDEEGRTYHLGVKTGEVASRIILVGEHSRAKRVSQLLSDVQGVGTTHRDFHSFTGHLEGTPVTVISIGMGFPMMDFAVREIAQVTKGDLSIIRLGTCGTINRDIAVGTVAVAERSAFVRTDYTAFGAQNDFPYDISTRVLGASAALTANIDRELKKNQVPVVFGTDITCDTFYGSQGRHDSQFDDRNQHLIERLEQQFPKSSSVQMESYQLFHLADIVRGRTIHAAALAIVLAQRHSKDFLSPDRKQELEKLCGISALRALVAT